MHVPLEGRHAAKSRGSNRESACTSRSWHANRRRWIRRVFVTGGEVERAREKEEEEGELETCVERKAAAR